MRTNVGGIKAGYRPFGLMIERFISGDWQITIGLIWWRFKIGNSQHWMFYTDYE